MVLSIYYLPLVIAAIVLIGPRLRKITAPYPPGPPAEPIVGHLRVLPRKNQEVVFREMSKIYGDILYFHLPGKSYLVLNSLKSAVDLLEKRSGIYSDRMRFWIYETMGWESTLTSMPYGKRFQKHRKLLHEYLHEKKCVSYWPLQTQCARRMLVRLVDKPENWRKHLERFTAEIIIKITYGKDIVDNDPHLKLCDDALVSLTSCGSMGSTPVDFLPILRYFPSWFPGTHYIHLARTFRSAVKRMHDYPFEAVQRQMKDGTAQPSYAVHHLSQLDDASSNEEHMEDLRGSAGQLFAAGAETTSTALSFFILAMVLFPDVQKKSQREIDLVVGKSRLPEMDDRASLPYVEAVVCEVLRWNTVLPSGIPHRSTEDDIYNGMYIPKGTVVIYNAYAILRDESVYANPDTFNPSRYLPKPEGNGEPRPIGQFGFGRRICSGKHLADASLFISIASILATFDIGRVKDDSGNEIVPEVELMTGVTSHPKPFLCAITPRDKASESLINLAQFWE